MNIFGVHLFPQKQIPDERGRIMHMLRSDDPHFEKFGEIYFSCVYPGVVKGWHIHSRMTLNYACIVGQIKLVLYDPRPDSPSYKSIQEFYIGENHYCLIQIPPGIWNAFKGTGAQTAIVANCASEPHDPEEIQRISPFSPEIPYDWNLKHG